MARKTKKYVMAKKYMEDNGLFFLTNINQKIYECLEDKSVFWDAKKGVWEHKEHKPSTSVFEADDGSPTGIGKIRVMAHPNDLSGLITALKKAPGIRVIEISEKTYPNRKGSGERIYTTVLLSGGEI